MTLTELADAADVTTRTVRYYIVQGLLPPPVGAGPSASYGEQHLGLLRAIKAFQGQYLPLAEIRNRLSGEPTATPDQPAQQASPRESSPSSSGDSARDYIAAALARSLAPVSQGAPAARPISAWERHELSPDFELNVRRPLSREQNRQLEKLLDAARLIFKEKP